VIPPDLAGAGPDGHRNDVIFGLDVCSVTTSLVSASKGIAAGLAWGPVAEATVVYIDRGVSPDTKRGIADAEAAERPVEYRLLAEST
jgi:hypothetical protein